MISTRSTIRKHGFSLIEVAIALVIFVIGALAIIQIFPGALGVINNNGDQLAANNLNRSVLARLRSENGVPDATFNIVSDSGLPATTWTLNADHSGDWRPSKTAVAGVPRFNDSLPKTADTDIADSALMRYRAIQGEKCQVVNLGGTLYVLTQFPIIANYQPVICQNEFKDLIIDKDGNLKDDTGAAYTVPANSVLYVSYLYQSDSPSFTNPSAPPPTVPSIWGIQEEPVKAGDSKVNPPPSTATRGGLKASGVVATSFQGRLRAFKSAGEFADAGDAARGLIKITTVGTLENDDFVSVDYVADWSTMLQDGAPTIVPDNISPTPLPPETIPTTARQLTLGAPFIEDQSPNAIVSLLIRPAPSVTPTATPPPPQKASYGSGGLAGDALYQPTEDDLRAGRVSFEMNGNEGARARVAYQTRDGWHQQLSVAAISYKPFVVGNGERWRDYFVGTDNIIYFHAGESGKSVTVFYNDGLAANSPQRKQQYVIEENVIDTPGGIPAAFDSSGRVAKLALTDGNGNFLSGFVLRGIQGNSATVRTAYLNGSRYTQSLLTTNINRSFDQ